MDDRKSPGWYKDPFSDDESFRFWDGQEWSEFTQSKLQVEACEKGRIPKKPNKSIVSLSRALYVGVGIFASILKFLIMLFVLDVILVFLFQMGGWSFAGKTFVEWGYMLTQITVLGTFVLALVGYPLSFVSQNTIERSNILQASNEAVSFSDMPDRLNRDFLAILKIKKQIMVCSLLSSIVVAIIGLIMHDLLISLIGSPWGDFADIFIFVSGSQIIAAAVSFVATKKYQRETPDLYDYATRQKYL